MFVEDEGLPSILTFTRTHNVSTLAFSFFLLWKSSNTLLKLCRNFLFFFFFLNFCLFFGFSFITFVALLFFPVLIISHRDPKYNRQY